MWPAGGCEIGFQNGRDGVSRDGVSGRGYWLVSLTT